VGLDRNGKQFAGPNPEIAIVEPQAGPLTQFDT